MFCRKCGKPVDGMKFCPSCGTPVEVLTKKTPLSEDKIPGAMEKTFGTAKRKSGKKPLLIAMSALALILFIAGISFIIGLKHNAGDAVSINKPEVSDKRTDNVGESDIDEDIGNTEEALNVLQPGFETTEDVALSGMEESIAFEKLIANYPKVRSEQFITCVAADFPSLPDWSRGLISIHRVDVNSDGEAEAILTRVDEHCRIFVDIYDITDEEPTVCSSTEITSFDYCDQIDVELFYNTVLNCWCITADSSYSGAYTGATEYNLALYKIAGREVSCEKTWNWNNVVMMLEDNNIVSEAKQSGVNFLSCQDTDLNQPTPENQYHELARIQSEVLSGEYPSEFTWGMTISGNATQKVSGSSPVSIPTATPTSDIQQPSESDTYELEASPFPKSALTQEEKIQKIRDWFQEIQGFQLRKVCFGDAACACWHGDDLVCCEYYEQGSVWLPDPVGTTYRYYYRDGQPFFALFTGVDYIEDNTLRLYFWDGELIRWMENQDAPHDSSHETYAAYYEQAIYHYNNMVDRPNG